MLWFVLYGAVAMIVSVAAVLFGDWAREPGVTAPSRPGLLAVVVGLAWPVVLLGLVQWGLVAAYSSHVSRASRPTTPARQMVRAGELHRVA